MYENQEERLFDQPEETTVSVGNWIGTFFLSAIPLVNLVLLFYWAFGAKTKSKRNYGRAMLWMVLIEVVFSLLLLAIFSVQILAFLSTISMF